MAKSPVQSTCALCCGDAGEGYLLAPRGKIVCSRCFTALFRQSQARLARLAEGRYLKRGAAG
ncbi:MAG: hypothetical protein H5T97_10755 [Firmicutes bacterium]|nr:hypothetical protein [Bacillota bacterium]